MNIILTSYGMDELRGNVLYVNRCARRRLISAVEFE